MKIPVHLLDRRTFFVSSLLLGAHPTFAQSNLLSFLQSKEGSGAVRAIIETHFGLLGDASFYANFHERIARNVERAPPFHELLNRRDHHEALVNYVVEEFAVQTNYFELEIGAEQQIRLIVSAEVC